ncbi:hypothetical protein ACFYOK_08470 [Microbispora bryophytorum]
MSGAGLPCGQVEADRDLPPGYQREHLAIALDQHAVQRGSEVLD